MYRRTVLQVTAVFFLFVCASSLIAQLSDKTYFKFEPSTLSGFCIPDPNSKLEIIGFATHPEIAKELGLSEAELSALQNYLGRSGGNLRSITVKTTNLKPEEVREKFKQLRRQNEEFADELLAPEQWERLRQIVYHIEISRLGFGPALANGKLGVDAGVYENQRSNILEKSERIDRKARERIAQILSDAQSELVRELSAEQRKSVEAILGKPFFYREARSVVPPRDSENQTP